MYVSMSVVQRDFLPLRNELSVNEINTRKKKMRNCSYNLLGMLYRCIKVNYSNGKIAKTFHKK